VALGKLADVQFRLRHESVPFWVDVHLRCFGDRWLAVAEIAGELELGLGQSPGEALHMSLVSLGPAAASALLSDQQLFGVSCEVLGTP
jgi:hypothetical protein